jgi:hypothetical protein
MGADAYDDFIANKSFSDISHGFTPAGLPAALFPSRPILLSGHASVDGLLYSLIQALGKLPCSFLGPIRLSR